VSGIVDEAAVFYQIELESGWVQFRPERLPDLLAAKQRAALSKDRLLAVIPASPDRSSRYLFTSRIDPRPEALNGPPEAWVDAEARRLWAALNERFPGELPGSRGLP
jgi:hypothetical protein